MTDDQRPMTDDQHGHRQAHKANKGEGDAPAPTWTSIGRWWQALRPHALVLPIYFVLTLVFTYPTILHLTDAIGGEQDNLENYWNLWWTYQAFFKLHQDPFNATYMFHPFGLPLYFHTYNFLNAMLSLPLQLLWGTAAAYNLLNLFAFTMAGVGAYTLVWYITRRRAAAFIAGLIYAFSPYMEFHLRVGQPFMLSLEWIPLYLLTLLKGVRERWQWLVLAAVFLVFIGLTDWHYTSYSLVITALVGLYEAIRVLRTDRRPKTEDRGSRTKNQELRVESQGSVLHPSSLVLRPKLHALALLVGKLALVGGLFAVGISPILVPMLRELARTPYAVRPLYHSIIHSTDLVAFFLPSIYHPLWGHWASGIFYRIVPSFVTGGMATLGYVALALGICALWGDRRRSGLFALMFVTFFVLALGPYLQVNGQNSSDTDHPIPMPYLLFNQLPFMNIQRIPSRFVSVVMLSLAVLAGIGVAWLWGLPAINRFSRRGRSAVLMLLAGLILFEYWPTPIPITPIGPQAVSAFYNQLGADQDDYAIMEVPYKGVPSMFYQTHHDKRTVGGRIAREVQHPWSKARFFGPLLRSEVPWREIGVDNSPAAERAALGCQNVRYVVFYKQMLPEQQPGARALEKQLFSGIKPAYEDSILRAYGPLTDVGRELYWTPSRSEWYDAEKDTSGDNSRWIKGDTGSLLVYPCESNAAQTTSALLSLDAYSFGHDRTVQIEVDGQQAGYFALSVGHVRNIKVMVPVHAGENQVTFHSIESATSPATGNDPSDPRLLSINVSRVSVVPLR